MMTPKDKCPVCCDPGARIALAPNGGRYTVDCPLCGHYSIGEIAAATEFPPEIATRRHLFSGLLRNGWEVTGKDFVIIEPMIRSWESIIKASPVPVPSDTDVVSKADAVLRHIRRRSEFPGEVVTLKGKSDYPAGFCRNEDEFRFCLGYLVQRGFSEHCKRDGVVVPWAYRITPAGWEYLTGVGAETKDQGFIAMAFRSPFSDALRTSGLEPGVTAAGYKPMRIDSKEHNNRIDDEIVAEIRKSRFLVADLTGNNAGAYFEAGFALGLGRPVIWTCEQKQIDAKDVHFDARQYSIVPWTENQWADFAKRLTQRIEATLGLGRYKAERAPVA